MLITDNELIGKYLFKEDSAAFEELVRRHSALVMGVCRGMLMQTQDAEDAFQATFLILSRKAKSLLDHGSIAGWLYQTAVRNCLQVRRRKSRFKETEMVEDPIRNDEPWQAISTAQENDLVYQEINRLPKNYRDAIVLCHLNGHSRAEAAELLDWTEAGVKAALSRGRNMLRKRLIRSGVLTSVVLAMLHTSTASAQEAVSDSLVTSAIQHCQGLTPNLPVGSSAQFVQTLANNGVMSMHAITAIKSCSIAAALLIGVALPLGVLAQQTKTNQPSPSILIDTTTSSFEPKSANAVVAVSFEQDVTESKEDTKTKSTELGNRNLANEESDKNQSIRNQFPNGPNQFSIKNSEEYWRLMLKSYELKAEALKESAIKTNSKLTYSESFEYQAKAVEAKLNLRRIEFEKANPELTINQTGTIELNSETNSNAKENPASIHPGFKVVAIPQPARFEKITASISPGDQVDVMGTFPNGSRISIAKRLSVYSVDIHALKIISVLATESDCELIGKYAKANCSISAQPSSFQGLAVEPAPVVPRSIAPPAQRDPIQAQILQLEIQLADLSQQFGAGHPEVKKVRTRLTQLRKFVQGEVSNSIPPASTAPVEPGESLIVESPIDPSLNRRVTIQADHTISLPLIGTINVRGQTVGQIENILDQKFSSFVKNPSIFVARESASTPLRK